MQVGAVQKLISIFDQSFRIMGVVVSLEKLEYLSVTIHRAMAVQTRHFHTLEHVFNFFAPANPVVSLAALYHDIVYHQVDRGFSPHIWDLISAYIRQEHENFYIKKQIPTSDRLFYLTLDIFELSPGQKLSSTNSSNEFLSALVLNKQLGGLVADRDLALMILCIEATIPFRAKNSAGRSHFDLLEMRLPEVFERHGLSINRAGLIEAIQTAVEFANKDIENFAELEPSRFLENTWKLLPETNAALRLPDAYSIGAYRLALRKMADFFENLSVEVIFHRYQNVPPLDIYTDLVLRAGRNIQIARQYLDIKLMGASILEALAQATGGDAPLSLFMGDIPRDGLNIKRLEYYLPELDDPAWADRNSALYKVFDESPASESSFDLKNSPLPLFVFKSVSPERLSVYLEKAEAFHAGRLLANDFLKALDPSLVRPIALASAIMVFTRRQALLQFASEDHSQPPTGLL